MVLEISYLTSHANAALEFGAQTFCTILYFMYTTAVHTNPQLNSYATILICNYTDTQPDHPVPNSNKHDKLLYLHIYSVYTYYIKTEALSNPEQFL